VVVVAAGAGGAAVVVVVAGGGGVDEASCLSGTRWETQPNYYWHYYTLVVPVIRLLWQTMAQAYC
jgi:hypothetical protein